MSKKTRRDVAKLRDQVRELIIAGNCVIQELGDQIEGCTSDGCSWENPCSYCEGGNFAIKAFNKASGGQI